MTDPIMIGGTDLRSAARRWARAFYDTPLEVRGLGPMPGNSGLSFGFEVVGADGSVLDEVVLRLAPPGVRRSGNTDVLRQVPLLRALEKAGIPVAPLLWSSPDESCFGTDAIVQRRLHGRPLRMWEPGPGTSAGPGGVAPYLEAAAAVLAQVHGLPWSQALPDWAAPRGADAELATWAALLTRTGDPGWIAAGTRLREALAATAPAEPPVGLFHGDFQTHNILFDPDGGKVLAVVDWEIAGIGLQGLDVGWLAVMTDPSFWAREHQDRMDVVAPEGAVREWYEDAVGRTLADYDWYRALAAYRFGVIAAFNIRLHRTGRRPDASYELLVSSVERLFSRGFELTGRGAPRSEVGA